jgi:DNA mismatch repair protein MutS
LTALAERLAHVGNAAMRVREWQGDVVFLHEVVAGVADRSYGIQVARLAGLPASVTARAAEVLEIIEKSNRGERQGGLFEDLPLFSAAARTAPSSQPDPLGERLAAIRPDELSPREALDLLYEIKALLARKG